MIDRLTRRPDPGVDLGIGLHGRTGCIFAGYIGLQRRLSRHLAQHSHALAQRAAVLLGGEVVGEDRRIIHRVGRFQPHPPAALGPQLTDVEGEAVLGHADLAMVLHDHRHGVNLQIRPVEIGPGTQERPRLQALAAAQALAEQQVVQSDAQGLQQALALRIDRYRQRAFIVQADVQMVLQIGAYALQLMHHGHAMGVQLRRIADPGQLQDLRRLHRPRAKQHLGVGMNHPTALGLCLVDLDARRPTVVDHDFRRAHRRHTCEVRAVERRMQIAPRRAPALAVVDGQLVGSEAFLLKAVEIVGQRMAGLGARGYRRGENRIWRRRLGDLQRSLPAVVRVRTALQRLGTLEVGQHVGIAPAGQAHLAPLIIVARVAANIDHAVDRGGSAPALPSGPP